VRVAICDDHLTFGDALQAVLADRGHEVVARSGSPYDNAGFAGSDAIVLDLGFPGVDGCEAVDAVRHAAPAAAIVVLTGSADLNLIERAFDHGAKGAVLKSEGIDELESVLTKVGAPGGELGRETSGAKVRSREVQALRKRRQAGGPGPDLTDREREVLEKLTSGSTTAEIAESMGVRISTVRTHVQHLLAKFGAHSRLELVASAKRLRIGVLPGPNSSAALH